MQRNTIIACHACDLLHRLPSLPHGGKAICERCGTVLHTHKPNSLDRTIALALAGMILFFLSNAFPLLAIKNEGLVQEMTLIAGVTELYGQHKPGLSALVFMTCIFVPFIQLAGLIYVLIPIKFNRIAKQTPLVFRCIRKVQPWGMMEVFMLGVLVSVVKLAKLATVIPGISLYSFAALIFVLAGAAATIDPHLVWSKLEASK